MVTARVTLRVSTACAATSCPRISCVPLEHVVYTAHYWMLFYYVSSAIILVVLILISGTGVQETRRGKIPHHSSSALSWGDGDGNVSERAAVTERESLIRYCKGNPFWTRPRPHPTVEQVSRYDDYPRQLEAHESGIAKE